MQNIRSYLNKKNLLLLLVDLSISLKNNILIFFKILFYKKNNKKINSVLILRTGSLGDNICSIPALNIIRNYYKTAEITLLSKDNIKSFSIVSLTGNKLVDKNINYFEINLINLYKLLLSKKYDLIIDLSQCMAGFFSQLRNLIFFRLCGIKYAINWRVETSLLFRKEQEFSKNFENEVNRMISRLMIDGVELENHPKEFSHLLDSIPSKNIENILNSIHLKYIVIAPESNKKIKEWDIDKFLELAINLKIIGYAIIIVGTRKDFLFDNIDQIYDCRGIMQVKDLIYIIKKSFLVVSNDSAAAHISAICNIPVVSIFSAWSFPNKWYPNGRYVKVIRKNIDCSVCYNDQCTTRNCMDISQEEVFNTINELIEICR